jgi:hypothetical protein
VLKNSRGKGWGEGGGKRGEEGGGGGGRVKLRLLDSPA